MNAPCSSKLLVYLNAGIRRLCAYSSVRARWKIKKLQITNISCPWPYCSAGWTFAFRWVRTLVVTEMKSTTLFASV